MNKTNFKNVICAKLQCFQSNSWIKQDKINSCTYGTGKLLLMLTERFSIAGLVLSWTYGQIFIVIIVNTYVLNYTLT